MPYENYGDGQDSQMAANADQSNSAYSVSASQWPSSLSSGGVLGSIVGGVTDLFTHAETNANNARATLENRKWQEFMASTGHRREVMDMKAAGLNPILSATGGSGAPVGSAPPIPQTPPADSAFATAMKGVEAFQGNQDLNSQMSLREKQEKNLESQSLNADAGTKTEETQQGLNRAAAAKAFQDTAYSAKQTELADVELKGKLSELPSRTGKGAAEGELWTRVGELAKKLGHIADTFPDPMKMGEEKGKQFRNWLQEKFPGAFSQ